MGEINTEHDGRLANELVNMAYAQNRYFTAQKEFNVYPTDEIPSEECDASFIRAKQAEWESYIAIRAQKRAYEDALGALASDETTAGDELIQKYVETIHLFGDNERSWLLEKMLVLREKLVPGVVFFFNNAVMTVAGTPGGDAPAAMPQIVAAEDYQGRPYQRLVWRIPVEGGVESVVVDEQEIVVGHQDVKEALDRYRHHAMSFSQLISRAQDYDVLESKRDSYKYRQDAADRAINELKREYPYQDLGAPGEMLAALESIGAIDVFISRLAERLTLGGAGKMYITYSRAVHMLAAYEKSKQDEFKGLNLTEIPIKPEEVLSLYRKLQSPGA